MVYLAAKNGRFRDQTAVCTRLKLLASPLQYYVIVDFFFFCLIFVIHICVWLSLYFSFLWCSLEKNMLSIKENQSLTFWRRSQLDVDEPPLLSARAKLLTVGCTGLLEKGSSAMVTRIRVNDHEMSSSSIDDVRQSSYPCFLISYLVPRPPPQGNCARQRKRISHNEATLKPTLGLRKSLLFSDFFFLEILF